MKESAKKWLNIFYMFVGSFVYYLFTGNADNGLLLLILLIFIYSLAKKE